MSLPDIFKQDKFLEFMSRCAEMNMECTVSINRNLMTVTIETKKNKIAFQLPMASLRYLTYDPTELVLYEAMNARERLMFEEARQDSATV